MAKRQSQPSPEHLPLVAELARKSPAPMILLSPRSRVLFLNDAFARLTSRDASHFRGKLVSTVVPGALLSALKKQPAIPQRWKVKPDLVCQLVRIPMQSGYGLAVIGAVASPPTESTILKIHELILGLEDDGADPKTLRAIRALLAPEGEAATRTPLEALLDALLSERKQRIAGLGINVSIQLGATPPIESRGAPGLLGAVLDHATLELSLRPEPRLLRIGSALETDGVLLVRVTHNGVQQASRLEDEARRHGLRLRAMSPGPGLGVTYAIAFPSS